jgi:protein-S-isoprenylcysteine O-methyltransferase Ste14
MRFVEIGQVAFKRRGLLLPIAVLLILAPSPPFAADPAGFGFAGLLVACIGQAIRVGTIGLAYIIRGGKDHRVYAEDLVTEGMYSHCRNPMYLGNLFILLGLGLASNSWLFALVGVPLALLWHAAIIAAEEDFLRGKFGAAYEAYCANVPRLLPRLAGLRATLRGMRFEWRRVVVQEYAKPFDWLSAIAIVVIVNLWWAGKLARHPALVALLVLVAVARLALWLAARGLKQRAANVG